MTSVGSALVSLILLASANHALGDTDVESIQPFKTEQVGEGIRLTNLNPNINAWYLLRLTSATSPSKRGHLVNLENSRAPGVALRMNQQDSGVLEFVANGQVVDTCSSWLKEADASSPRDGAYAAICGGRLFVRNSASGYTPTIEGAADTLREYGGGLGEWLVETTKSTLFEGKYAEDADTQVDANAKGGTVPGLSPARLDARYQDKILTTHQLGIALSREFSPKQIKVGQWYPIAAHSGVMVSILAPGMVAPEILSSFNDRVAFLQPRETNSLSYLVAFNLKTYSLGWAHGTRLPGVGWSDRMPYGMRQTFGGGVGPSGASNFGPVVNPGQVPPFDWANTVATISGGFQLHHGHFLRGPFAKLNKASHYGYIEDGVIMALPAAGLETIVAYADRGVTIKTWTEADNKDLSKVRYLRQNGLPLIQADDSGRGVPGRYVNNRGEGNWSGSAEGDNFTPRGGACLIERDGETYFVYGYFSAATPSAMARVFQAYGCKEAIHLDMNSPGQAYLSLLTVDRQSVKVEHLVRSMDGSDPSRAIPRYLAVPDFRDFFWIFGK